MRPILNRYNENEWEFVFPPEIDNETVYDEYCAAVELLDYDDIKAEKIFKSLIERYPYYIDAYNHLSIAFRNQNKRFESYLTAEKSYLIGKECLPQTFNLKKHKLIWSNIENRPFLRSCQIYGLECQDKGDYAKAMNLYDEILSINKDDHQGVKILKLECLFATKDYMAARKLINKYSAGWSIDFAYGKVAIEIIEGNTKGTKKHLAHALKMNSFLPKEIIKEKHKAPPPHRIPGEPFYDAGIPVGSIQEAYEYWNRNKSLYTMKKIVDFYKTNQLVP